MAFEIENGVLKKYIYEDGVTEVIIPDSVTSIGDHAFSGRSFLESVVIPESVTSIGDSAFSGCFRLTSVVIPDSVISIGANAFYECDSLTSVVIPDSVISIGANAFYECVSLTSVVIPDSVISIGERAFMSSGLETITIPDTVKEIGNFAFSETEWFENQTDDDFVIVGDGNLIRINVDGDVTIPDTVKIICCEAGWYSDIERLVIPDSVIEIKELVFYDVYSLYSVTFGNSLKKIACNAFPDDIKDIRIDDPTVAELVERQTGLISNDKREKQAEQEVYDFYIENRETWLEEIKNKKSE